MCAMRERSVSPRSAWSSRRDLSTGVREPSPLMLASLRCCWNSDTGKQSPDAFIQMAMQLAYRRMHGRGTPTYETASTRLFLHGRTDVIRTYSEDSQRWVEAVISGKHDVGGWWSMQGNQSSSPPLQLRSPSSADQWLTCESGFSVQSWHALRYSCFLSLATVQGAVRAHDEGDHGAQPLHARSLDWQRVRPTSARPATVQARR